MSLWKVLVVDDNPTVRKLICELFTRGLDFAVCGQGQDGRDGLIQAQKLKPNLIVTDLNMPLLNGWEETNAFQTLTPAVPVILYSADMDGFVVAGGICGPILSSDYENGRCREPDPNRRVLAGRSCRLKGPSTAARCLTSKRSNQTDFCSRSLKELCPG